MTPRLDRKDPRVARTKEAALRATTALLAEHGLAGTSIEAISARARVPKTTIYEQSTSPERIGGLSHLRQPGCPAER